MIAVMHAGRLQQYGTPHEVYARPANRLVADFMGLVNLVPGKVLGATDGVATVEAGAGLRLDVAVPGGTTAGDAVDLVIRPENIRLHASAGRNGSAIARITDSTFLGNISEYYITLEAGQSLRVQTHPQQRFAIGDTVVVEVDAGQCSVFRTP
jgi:iron(III) transport system ATP-binding protein